MKVAIFFLFFNVHMKCPIILLLNLIPVYGLQSNMINEIGS